MLSSAHVSDPLVRPSGNEGVPAMIAAEYFEGVETGKQNADQVGTGQPVSARYLRQ